MSRRWQLSIAILVVLSLMVVCASLWKVNTSIVAFLPAGEDRQMFEVSKALADSTLTRRMVLSLGVEGQDDSGRGPPLADGARRAGLSRAARALADDLARSPRVRAVRRGVQEAAERALFETYFPRRNHFWSIQPERELPPALSDAGLAKVAQTLKDGLAGPEGPLVRKLAPEDPLQLFRSFLGRLEAQRPAGLEVDDGQFFSADGHAILLLELADSPFDGARQRELLRAIEEAVERLPRVAGRAVELEASGVNRFAVATEAAVKGDLTRISVLSLGGLLLLFGVLLRRPGRLLFTFTPLAIGLLVAAAASLLLIGELHVLTLAFGAALLGVAIDYPVHLLNHHDLAGAGSPASATLRKLGPSLLLAGSSTAAGLFALGVVGFPGLREMAIFACAGVVGALAAAVLLVSLLGPSGGATPLQRAAARWLHDAMGRAVRRRWTARAALVVIGVVGVVGLWRARWNDDLDALHQPSAELMAEDGRVRARIGETDTGRFVVSRGADLERALERNEAAVARLAPLVAEGALGGYASVDGVLRSSSLQRRNVAALRAQPAVATRMLRALEEAGFASEHFAPYVAHDADLEREPLPLTWSDLRGGPLEPLAAPFVAEDLGAGGEDAEDRAAAVVIHLRDVRRPDAVRAALADLEQVQYFDQRGSLDAMYQQVRRRTSALLLVGLALMATLAALRYRSWGRSLTVVLPSWASGALTVALLSAFGIELHLLHVVGLLLVLSMGIDHGIFLVDAERSGTTPAALLSVALAWLSTLLSFGLLALSTMPALRALGQTVAIGVSANALLAPLVLLALRGRRDVPEGAGEPA